MLRIRYGSGLSIRFICMLGVFGASTGDFPSYRNGDSHFFPLETNQFNDISSNRVSFLYQILGGTPPSLSFNVPAASTSTSVSNTNQPGIFNNGFERPFKPSVVKRDTESVSSASTIEYSTESASGKSVSATGNTNVFPLNTYNVPPSVPIDTYQLLPPSASVNIYNVPPSVPINAYQLLPPSALINTFQVAPPSGSVPARTYPVVPPSVESLTQSFSQALSSIPAVQNFLTVPISVSELSNIFYTKTTDILVRIGHSDPHSLASRVSQPVNLFDVFTFPLLFKVIGATFVKFLINEGVVIPPNVAQLYSSYVEKYIESHNISTVDSAIEALWNGGASFINGLGFDLLEKSDYLTQLFYDELTALKN